MCAPACARWRSARPRAMSDSGVALTSPAVEIDRHAAPRRRHSAISNEIGHEVRRHQRDATPRLDRPALSSKAQTVSSSWSGPEADPACAPWACSRRSAAIVGLDPHRLRRALGVRRKPSRARTAPSACPTKGRRDRSSGSVPGRLAGSPSKYPRPVARRSRASATRQRRRRSASGDGRAGRRPLSGERKAGTTARRGAGRAQRVELGRRAIRVPMPPAADARERRRVPAASVSITIRPTGPRQG